MAMEPKRYGTCAVCGKIGALASSPDQMYCPTHALVTSSTPPLLYGADRVTKMEYNRAEADRLLASVFGSAQGEQEASGDGTVAV